MSKNVTFNCDKCSEEISEQDSLTRIRIVTTIGDHKSETNSDWGEDYYLCDKCKGEFMKYFPEKPNPWWMPMFAKEVSDDTD
jgi:predicted SprT family Zn-dependent metalloprotease